VIARRFGNGHEPDAACAEIGVLPAPAVIDVVELLNEAVDVSNSVSIAVMKGTDEDLVTRRGGIDSGCPGVLELSAKWAGENEEGSEARKKRGSLDPPGTSPPGT
jgi:hypothetical protein